MPPSFLDDHGAIVLCTYFVSLTVYRGFWVVNIERRTWGRGIGEKHDTHIPLESCLAAVPFGFCVHVGTWSHRLYAL